MHLVPRLVDMIDQGHATPENQGETKIELYARAAQLGHSGAGRALQEEQEKANRAERERAFQEEQAPRRLNFSVALFRECSVGCPNRDAAELSPSTGMLRIIGIIGRITAIIAAAVALVGCFNSEYDLSQQLKPEFPIAGGQYAGSGPGPRSVQVSRAADSYRYTYTSEDGREINSHIQFFRVPESSDHYIVQTWTGGLNSQGKLRYEYVYARIEGNKVTFLPVLYKDLPSDIQRLTAEELYTVGAAIPDGPRDAVYILREVLRRGTKLTEERHFFLDE